MLVVGAEDGIGWTVGEGGGWRVGEKPMAGNPWPETHGGKAHGRKPMAGKGEGL